MPSALVDTGWVPATSGSISVVFDGSNYDILRIILASSGTNGSTATMGWTAGADSVCPPFKNSMKYAMSPKVSGTYSISNPGANSNVTYYFGSTSGTTQLAAVVPAEVDITLTQGSGSWARVVIEGKAY